MIVQRREVIRTAIASQKIEHELRVFEVVWVIAILVAHTGEIWGKLVRLWVELSHTLEMYDGVQT